MRIAEGREHSAEVRRDILHDERKNHVLFFLRIRQNEITEWQKGQECHIVGNQHRADKGYVNERQNRASCRFENFNRPFCKEVEKVYVFESANDGKRRQKAGERVKIEIIQILLVGRNKEARYDCQQQCNQHNDIFSGKSARFFQKFVFHSQYYITSNKKAYMFFKPINKKYYYYSTGIYLRCV